MFQNPKDASTSDELPGSKGKTPGLSDKVQTSKEGESHTELEMEKKEPLVKEDKGDDKKKKKDNNKDDSDDSSSDGSDSD